MKGTVTQSWLLVELGRLKQKQTHALPLANYQLREHITRSGKECTWGGWELHISNLFPIVMHIIKILLCEIAERKQVNFKYAPHYSYYHSELKASLNFCNKSAPGT